MRVFSLSALLTLSALAACSPSSPAGCALPASCPAPQFFERDAGISAELGAECFDCADGGQEVCVLEDGGFECSCTVPC